jgi:hypothetical protein
VLCEAVQLLLSSSLGSLCISQGLLLLGQLSLGGVNLQGHRGEARWCAVVQVGEDKTKCCSGKPSGDPEQWKTLAGANAGRVSIYWLMLANTTTTMLLTANIGEAGNAQ